MPGFLDRFRRRFSEEVPLFLTHRPEFQDPLHRVGSLVEHEGALYVITRWEEGHRVPLRRGGSVTEWRVFGRPAAPEEVETLVAETVERLTAPGSEPDGGPEGGPEDDR